VVSAQRSRGAAVLTRREEEVLSLVSLGLTNAEVATELRIATRTVGKHLEHVYEKLGARTRTGALARWAKRR
jgi:DNA-binding CsgD family transcriptional regulator